ncbi:MAG: hypothetical protein JJU11_13535, partial [Candidatus Sumerlaeia bacterium]|nr:hypothetical protein [Candidatus Sumerlaeia bacterium]
MGENLDTGDKVVAALLEEELITPSQANRLGKLLDKGVDLHEALHKTPLVEQVKLSVVISKVRSKEEAEQPPPQDAAPSLPPPPPPSPTPPNLEP